MHPQYRLNLTALMSVVISFFIPFCASSAEPVAPCTPSRLTNNIINLSDCNTAVNPTNAKTDIRAFITDHATDLNLSTSNLALQLLNTTPSLHGQYTRFQETINGHPLYNTTISVYQDKAGRIQRARSIGNTHLNAAHTVKNVLQKHPSTLNTIITQQQAEEIAVQHLKKNAQGITYLKIAEHAQKVWYPVNNKLHLAWKLLVAGENPLGDFVMIINANTGDLLLQQNRLEFFDRGQGRVFQPNPIQSSGLTSLVDNNNATRPILTSQLINITLRGLSDNSYLLKGQFVDVASFKTQNTPQSNYPEANQPNRKYMYNRNDPRFEQVMVYNTIDTYQRYLQALGFNNNNPKPNGIHNSPIMANAHWNSSDLSVYRPSDDTLRFGDGGVDDAEDADIILHEFGHAIQHSQNPDWGCAIDDKCEMKAMGEGFSDYIAADFHAGQGNKRYQHKHAACVGEWDGTAYRTTVPACLRRVDENKHYPQDITNEKYADSAIWSRTLWDIRNALGSNIANQIILEHHYALPIDATMPMAALEMLNVDAELFGGFYETALRRTFCARGILRNKNCIASKHKQLIKLVTKDSFINQSAANTNYGDEYYLIVGGTQGTETRTILGFTLGNVNIKKIKSVVLELSIVRSNNQWGNFGRTIDIHPVTLDFSEGLMRGNHETVWPDVFNKAPGITWNCPTDNKLDNHQRNCPLPWSGGLDINKKLSQGSSVPVTQTNETKGKVRWTVTNDVKAGIRRWLIKKTFPEPGQVEFYSKEGACKKHADALNPRLIITLK